MKQALTEERFERLVSGIIEDREIILKHNPIGTPEETLLWMLLGSLISYLSVPEDEMPCFTGVPDAKTYRDAIKYVLNGRIDEESNIDVSLDRLA